MDCVAPVQELAIRRLVATAAKNNCLAARVTTGNSSHCGEPRRDAGTRSGLLGSVTNANPKCSYLDWNAAVAVRRNWLYLGLDHGWNTRRSPGNRFVGQHALACEPWLRGAVGMGRRPFLFRETTQRRVGDAPLNPARRARHRRRQLARPVQTTSRRVVAGWVPHTL